MDVRRAKSTRTAAATRFIGEKDKPRRQRTEDQPSARTTERPREIAKSARSDRAGADDPPIDGCRPRQARRRIFVPDCRGVPAIASRARQRDPGQAISRRKIVRRKHFVTR